MGLETRRRPTILQASEYVKPPPMLAISSTQRQLVYAISARNRKSLICWELEGCRGTYGRSSAWQIAPVSSTSLPRASSALRARHNAVMSQRVLGAALRHEGRLPALGGVRQLNRSGAWHVKVSPSSGSWLPAVRQQLADLTSALHAQACHHIAQVEAGSQAVMFVSEHRARRFIFFEQLVAVQPEVFRQGLPSIFWMSRS